ncbi:hypothetical protein MKZ38_003246 [Zalerion maritima]|uniref:F-box domain-containing protein n=1 Tax=Zalerion maritima TaxID=339359 RepID=A0AAD5S142_9PEZI|nr:hypothetical protein MKZ38_003246 [Zalerion maritima]
MESLPVELIRLIFGHCVSSSVRNLREVNHLYADVGYEYLLGRQFTSIGWGKDINNLHNIAHHERLRPYIHQVVLNFSEVDEYYARHTTYFRHFTEDREALAERMRSAYSQYSDLYEHVRVDGELSDQYSMLKDALCQLPNLNEVEVAFTRAPFNNDILKEIYEVPACRKLDHKKAADYLNAIISALNEGRIEKLIVDWFPFELFRHPEHRRHWFRFENSLDNLRHLDLIIDPELTAEAPHTQLVAINGLGRILRVCKNLTSLALAFRNGRRPRMKTRIWFSELIGDDYTYPELTDLKLEGMSCAEGDLSEFLVRHAPTLKRLRLGGRGLAKPEEPSMGGMMLGRGQWRYLFDTLRKGMTSLEKLHLEGDFVSLNHQNPRHEAYIFHPTTDGAWNEADPPWRNRSPGIDSVEFERFVLEGGTYPGCP